METINRTVIILSPVYSHPVNSGNSARISQLVNLLESFGCNVHFVSIRTFYFSMNADNSEMKKRYGDRFHSLNQDQLSKGTFFNRLWMKFLVHGLKNHKIGQDTFWVNHIYTKSNKTEFKELVNKIKPDVIIAEYAISAPMMELLNDSSIKVVDTHDYFTDRNKKIRSAGGQGTWVNLTANQEKYLLSLFDHVIAIQSEEKRSFEILLESDRTKVKLIDILELPSFTHKVNLNNKIIGFIGSNNLHNREGLKIFIDIHWEKILKAIPNATLLVAGSVSFESKANRVKHIGKVGDLKIDFYDKCSLIINPCLTGTGLKIKTVEGMSHGLPVVTTPEGASGILDEAGFGLQISDLHSKQFSDACINLLKDDQYNLNCGIDSRLRMENRFAKSKEVLKNILNQGK